MTLTEEQRKTIPLLSQSPLVKKVYWPGGTLLAYHYLHHRKSLDLDFFSDQELSFEELNDFIQSLKTEVGAREVKYRKIFDRHEFLLENRSALRIEFVH